MSYFLQILMSVSGVFTDVGVNRHALTMTDLTPVSVGAVTRPLEAPVMVSGSLSLRRRLLK